MLQTITRPHRPAATERQRTLRRWIRAILLVIVTSAAGCSWLDTDVERGFSGSRHWDGSVIYTTADVRLVTQRKNPVTHQIVTCSEPTPDVAKALSTAAQITAQGGSGTATGTVGASGGSAEAVAELAGRSTALLALRDGLYQTCEAYANGVLGADAYALVLSRYGQLMTTLFLGQDVATAVAGSQSSPPATTATSPPANSGGVPGGGGTPPTGGTNSGSSSSSDSASSSASSSSSAPGVLAAQAAPAPAPAAAPAGGTPSNSQVASGGTASGTAIAAAALARMNEDYFDLDRNLIQLLVVSCINENDPTRLRSALNSDGAPSGNGPIMNEWFTESCNQLKDLNTLANRAVQSAAIERESGHPAPAIEVTAGIAPPSSRQNSLWPASTTPAPSQVRFVQFLLLEEGYVDVRKADGVLGPNTQKGILEYQARKKLPLTGELDGQTIAALFNDVASQEAALPRAK